MKGASDLSEVQKEKSMDELRAEMDPEEAAAAGMTGSLYSSEWENTLQIYTAQFGRTYYFRAASLEDTQVWLSSSVMIVTESVTMSHSQ